jgi:hypothetical protein
MSATRPHVGWAVVAIAVGLMWFVLAFALAAGLVRGCCG